jgi:hypothetical protein
VLSPPLDNQEDHSANGPGNNAAFSIDPGGSRPYDATVSLIRRPATGHSLASSPSLIRPGRRAGCRFSSQISFIKGAGARHFFTLDSDLRGGSLIATPSIQAPGRRLAAALLRHGDGPSGHGVGKGKQMNARKFLAGWLLVVILFILAINNCFSTNASISGACMARPKAAPLLTGDTPGALEGCVVSSSDKEAADGYGQLAGQCGFCAPAS